MNKHTKIGIVLSILIVAAFGAYSIYNAPNQSSTMSKDPNALSDTDRHKLEAKLTEVESQIQNPPPGKEKYDLIIDKGDIYFELGQIDQARLAYEEAWTLERSRSGAYTALFELHKSQNNLDKAREYLMSYLALNDDSAARWRKVIDFEANVAKSDSETIKQLYLDGIVKTGEHADLIVDYAKFQESQGNYLVARDFWIKAGGVDPENKAEYDLEVTRLNQKLQEQGQ